MQRDTEFGLRRQSEMLSAEIRSVRVPQGRTAHGEGGGWAGADPPWHQPPQHWLGMADTELCILIPSFYPCEDGWPLPSVPLALSLCINKLCFRSPMYAFFFFL